MINPSEALAILEEYFATATPEEIMEDIRLSAPYGEPYHTEWGGIEKQTQQSSSDPRDRIV